MKKILVIGKTSYVGNAVVSYIKTNFPDDYEMEITDSRNGNWKNVDFGVYDAVYNVAGKAYTRAKTDMKEEYYRANRDLPIEICKKVKADGCPLFIQMSSIMVFGGMGCLGKKKVITKDTKPAPGNFYGDSKLQADLRLEKLRNGSFHVAIIRSPPIYNEAATGNFTRLVKAAGTMPVFPIIRNEQSMLYADNLAELVRRIVENRGDGYYYPQNRTYACTSELVRKLAVGLDHKIYLTRIFNPFLYFGKFFAPVINRAFGNMTYAMEMSDHFEWEYCVHSLDESLAITARKMTEILKL